MYKIMFIAMALIAQPAHSLNGNQWLENSRSDSELSRIAAFAFLSGTLKTLMYSGMANACPDVPDEVNTEQVKEIIIKWLEDNPENRHFEMPMIAWAALGDAYGLSPVGDDGFCS